MVNDRKTVRTIEQMEWLQICQFFYYVLVL